MNVGIIGKGFVGSAVEAGFRDKCNIIVYDPVLTESEDSVSDVIRKSSFVFVCVPTPMKKVDGGPIDTTIMDSVMAEISVANRDLIEKPVIIIKSTVIPSKLKEYSESYPDIRLVMSPEYLMERDHIRCFLNAELLVLGGKKEDVDAVELLFKEHSICKPCLVGKCDIIAAGLLKYMENCFLAMKVSFMNQFYDIAKLSGTDTSWDKIGDIFQLDSRMGNSHHKVPGPDGDRGWGGKCFPKDINAMIWYAESLGYDLDIMKKAWEINTRIRTDIDWAHIKGAVSENDTGE